jgi:CheY-like chemotaxis protein
MLQHPAVLIADDDDIFLTITESMVKMLGLPVMKARDGLEAITIFQEHAAEIRCVVLDIHMPRMNGIKTFRQLRKIGTNVQVIIASGYLTDSNREQLDPLQPAGYLKKPVSHRDLSELLTRCMAETGQ